MIQTSDVQRILDSRHGTFIPREGESWEELVRLRAPESPPWWQFPSALSHRRALARALERGHETERIQAFVVPFWIGNNDDEEPRDDEWRSKLVLFADGKHLFEVDAPKENPFWARLEIDLVRCFIVAQARHYNARVDSIERFGPYVVTETLVRAVVVDVLEGAFFDIGEPPRSMIPAFSMLVELAAPARGLPATVLEAANELAKETQFVTLETD